MARRSSARKGLTPAQADRMRQVEATRAEFDRLASLHREQFASVGREVASTPLLPKFLKLLMTAEKQSLSGVPRFDKSARRQAKERARSVAESWAQDLLALAEADRSERQARIDHHWDVMHSNEPSVVVPVLASTFASAGRPVRAVGIYDGDAGLMVRVGGPEVVPDAKPAVTPSGLPTLHKVNKTDRAYWYRQVASAQLLLAAKCAVAAAPGLTGVRAIAVDGAGVPLLAARLSRAGLQSAEWRGDAWAVLNQVDRNVRVDARGRAGELRTIDLRSDAIFGAVLTNV